MRALSNAAGQVAQTYQTDAFGVPLASGTQGAHGRPVGFTGEQHGAATALLYLRARYYDPQAGRFLTRDPWPASPGASQARNRYVYVGNNPATLADPSGMVWERGKDWWNNTLTPWSLDTARAVGDTLAPIREAWDKGEPARRALDEAHKHGCGDDLLQPCPFSVGQVEGGLGPRVLAPEDVLDAGAAHGMAGGERSGAGGKGGSERGAAQLPRRGTQ